MFPTILLFPYNKESDILLYEGGHTSEELVAFAMEYYIDNHDPPEVKEVGANHATNTQSGVKPDPLRP